MVLKVISSAHRNSNFLFDKQFYTLKEGTLFLFSSDSLKPTFLGCFDSQENKLPPVLTILYTTMLVLLVRSDQALPPSTHSLSLFLSLTHSHPLLTCQSDRHSALVCQ